MLGKTSGMYAWLGAGAKSQEPSAKSQEPRAKSQEPRAKSQEPRAKSLVQFPRRGSGVVVRSHVADADQTRVAACSVGGLPAQTTSGMLYRVIRESFKRKGELYGGSTQSDPSIRGGRNTSRPPDSWRVYRFRYCFSGVRRYCSRSGVVRRTPLARARQESPADLLTAGRLGPPPPLPTTPE